MVNFSLPDAKASDYFNSQYSPKRCLISMFFILGFLCCIAALIFYPDFALVLHAFSGICIFLGFFAILIDFALGRATRAIIPQTVFSKVKQTDEVLTHMPEPPIPGPPTKVTKDMRYYNYIASKELVSLCK